MCGIQQYKKVKSASNSQLTNKPSFAVSINTTTSLGISFVFPLLSLDESLFAAVEVATGPLWLHLGRFSIIPLAHVGFRTMGCMAVYIPLR
jgi:hypothetical protein